MSNRREAEEVEARQTLLQVESRFTETLGTSQQCCRCVKLTVQITDLLDLHNQAAQH